MIENLAHIHPQLQSLAIEVDALTPDPKNARKHDRRNIDAIKASLSKFGFRAALVAQRVGESLIVRAGNGRLQASRELGFTHVPVLVFDEGDDEAVAYAIADNRTAELAEWDWENLNDALASLGDVAFEVGFTDDELQTLSFGDVTDAATPSSPAREPLPIVEKKKAEEQTEQSVTYSVIVDMNNEQDQIALYEKLVGEGKSCRMFMS